MNLVVEQTEKPKHFIYGTQLLALQKYSALGNPRFKWEYNIKMDFKV
jgi:hypothetical protein